MPQPLQAQTRRLKTKWVIGLAALALLAVAMSLLLVRSPESKPPVASPALEPVAVSRTNLVLVAGRLCLFGQTNAFTGLMLEHSYSGTLRSRSAVTNGLLHGLSEGWHTNGQLQVTEHFTEGVSHGLRTKWHPNGVKLSEGMIVDGKFHGTFRRWSERSSLSEQVEFVGGQPDGLALAYFENGVLKSKTTIQGGKVVEQKNLKDGESNESTSETTTTLSGVP